MEDTKRIIEFEKKKIKGREDWEDAECSNCGKGFAVSQADLDRSIDTSKVQLRGYCYTYHQDNWGGLQLCEECFNKLEKIK